MHAERHEDNAHLWRIVAGRAVGEHDGHESYAQGRVVDELGEEGTEGPDAEGEQNLGVLAEDGFQEFHEEGGNAAFRRAHGARKGEREGEKKDDLPGDALVDHLTQGKQRLRVHLDHAHDGDDENADAGGANGVQKAGDNEVLGQEAGGEHAAKQSHQQSEHDLLHRCQDQGAVTGDSVDVEVADPADIRGENHSAKQDEDGEDEQSAKEGQEHVGTVVDGNAGQFFVGTHDGQWHGLEGDGGHAELSGEDNTENHHGRIAFTLLVAAQVTDGVEEAPTDENGGCSACQATKNHDRDKENVGKDIRSSPDKRSRYEPQGYETRQAVVAYAGAEYEDEEHHDDNGVAEAFVEQDDRLHDA